MEHLGSFYGPRPDGQCQNLALAILCVPNSLDSFGWENKKFNPPPPLHLQVIIVGINNTPQPLFIENVTSIIGIVCGCATIIPCALFAARIVRQVS